MLHHREPRGRGEAAEQAGTLGALPRAYLREEGRGPRANERTASGRLATFGRLYRQLSLVTGAAAAGERESSVEVQMVP